MFDPKDFLKLAGELSKPGLSEAQYRTAISRSLYGVFLWAREELDRRGQKVKATNEEEGPYEHSKVRECFKRGKFKHFAVSQRLGALYGLRYQSDYVLDSTVQHDDLLQALEYVEYIRNVFQNSLFATQPSNNQN